MSIKLSKGIGEIQKAELRYIWQPPDIFDEVHDNNVWLVYGRKGSGKSTLVEYLGTETDESHVIIIRPRKTNLFRRALAAIKDATDEDRIIEESFANTIDFILTTRIMRDIIDSETFFPTKTPIETIYKFMVQHGLHEGSVLRKAINLFSAAGKLKIVPDIDQVLERVEGGIDFDDAKEALIEYAKEINKSIILCIDDIDEVGFSFSRFDRLFVNGLLILMVRNNVTYLESEARIRIVLTIPSELYFHSTLWGGDWVTDKAECLNWDNPDDMHELVNKRIAVELGIKKITLDLKLTFILLILGRLGIEFSPQAYEMH